MKTVFITGGTGFAGSHLAALLTQDKTLEVHVTSQSGQNAFFAQELPQVTVHQIDLHDAVAVRALFAKYRPAQIYHLAAQAAVGNSFSQAAAVMENNVVLQLNVLEAVRDEVPEARVLVVGSGMEYDLIGFPTSLPITEDHPLGPVSPYAVSKVAQDLLGLSYAYSYGLDIVRVRPFNHIGIRQTTDFALPNFAKQIVAIERGQQQVLHVGNLSAVRDFTDVADVCLAYQTVMTKGKRSEVYNIGSGVGYVMADVLHDMCALAKTPISIEQDSSRVRPLDVPTIIADSSKVRLLGWQPHISLQESLRTILAEWRQTP